jgi:hypothetical protein
LIFQSVFAPQEACYAAYLKVDGMKTEAGLGAAALLTMAAFVGVSLQSGGKAATEGRAGLGRGHAAARPQAEAKSPFERGPCGDLEEKIQTFLLASPEGIAAPDSCYGEAKPKAQTDDAAQDAVGAAGLRTSAAALRYLIAIVPDPLHTHFSLSFDRLVEAIQQGAQDEGYLYDSSWMPWETDKPSLVLLADQDADDDRTKAKEDQPGILLFRRGSTQGENPSPNGSSGPYHDGLVVFVVGEEPTSGVHKRQFENAARWINALQPKQGGVIQPLKSNVMILGPTFSGSLPSLSQLLLDKDLSPAIPKAGDERPNPLLPIYSGGVTSESGVAWFVKHANAVPGLRFHSFQESDAQLLENYRHYLKGEGFRISHLAILSEDETAFGGFDDEAKEKECRPDEAEDIGPACVFYPRDISALRTAYQKQSIFNSGAGQQQAEAGRRTLSTDLADPDNEDHDTVRNYSGTQTALSQEAVLQQIVSVLRAHESEYVVLRSSNPLDQLFLSHFLRVAYPQGRVVIEGSDLLLRRESGAATLSGIMTLTTYPLLPWESHWASLGIESTRHSHRVFAQDLAEGTYVASRFLLHIPTPEDKNIQMQGGPCVVREESAKEQDSFLPPNCFNLPLSEYAPPFWANSGCIKNAGSSDPSVVCRRPSTWLSVLGRDGFWPVAALPRAEFSATHGKVGLTARVRNKAADLATRAWASVGVWRYLLRLEPSEQDYGVWPEWPPMPLSMKIFLLLMFLWALFHLSCCALPSAMVKPGHRAYFVRVPQGHHLGLIVLGSVFVALVPVCIEWGYGAMSATGEPVHFADAYRLLLFMTWLMAGAAVAVNAWIESPVSLLPNWQAKFRKVATPLAWYAGATCFAFCLMDLSLNENLTAANRIPTYWRAISLMNGVSPLVPLIALVAGLYLWFWYALQGLALFNLDGPLLPQENDLAVYVKPASPPEAATQSRLVGLLARARFLKPPTPVAQGPWNRLDTLRMFSHEEAGAPLEKLCLPFAKEFRLAAAVVFPSLLLVGYLVASDVPFRSLGSSDYSRFFGMGMAICAAFMLANAWQLLRIWLGLRQLLVFLDRLHLRRTLDALKGYSWGSVWRMGGRVLDVRYKLLTRQMETLTHLQNSLTKCKGVETSGWETQMAATQQVRMEFAKWYSSKWHDSKERNLTAFFAVQSSIAKTAGVVLAQVLVPYWRTEDTSLVQKLPAKDDDAKGGDSEAKGDAERGGSEPPNGIRNAEELVCLVYLGFIQNILGRMRTIVMQIAWLFVAAAIAVASYPFDPRPQVSGSMAVLFFILGTAIVIVYSQMHRDATLSLVTDTKPGELGMEFWFKLAAFGAGPALGLLATVFPELPGSLFSWLQPGLDSIK